MMKKYRKQLVLNESHMDIVAEVINTVPGINTFSDVVRYALLSVEGQTNQQKKVNEMQRKLNAMSKNTDILVEMVAGGFHKLDVESIGNSEETYIYQDAKRHVEKGIKRSTTVKSNIKRTMPKKDEIETNIKNKQPIKTATRNFI